MLQQSFSVLDWELPSKANAFMRVNARASLPSLWMKAAAYLAYENKTRILNQNDASICVMLSMQASVSFGDNAVSEC